MGGCLSWKLFTWIVFKFDGALLRRSWPCIYSERSLVVCGKELGAGVEATISRTKPQNSDNCQSFPADGLQHHTSAAFLSALVIAA